jgi:predicted Zn finger-like uncharacterized protein
MSVMQIICPSCSARYSLDESKLNVNVTRLRCSKCKAVFSLAKDKDPVTVISATIPAIPTGPRYKVLVANESPAFCATVTKILEAGPFAVTAHNDGKEAMAAIEIEIPDVVLLDVALPSMYGFEICEKVRKNPLLDRVKIILIASIYDKTKYKRTPSSLYGADAYIEKHHIPDSLKALVLSLATGDMSGTAMSDGTFEAKAIGLTAMRIPDPKKLADEESARQTLKSDEESVTGSYDRDLSVTSSASFYDACEKARRLARIIVSDILLYNQSKVLEGIRSGTLYELLADEIKEGRALYMRRVAPDVSRKTSFLDEAFDQLIATKRQEMNL